MKKGKQQKTSIHRRQVPAPIHRKQVVAGPGYVTFDLSVEPVAPDQWPSISVCMIVKNEAANLRGCIESLRDLSSEIIVVDTGSTDETVSIAEQLGARVHHFQWIDDFAAARNESLRHATGDWVFWLDADDRLSQQAIDQLKRAAAEGKADAFMCLVPSTNHEGASEVTEHVRLFRNHLGIHFQYAIHETAFLSVAELGLRLAYTDISIEHTGYHDQAAKARKAARNLAIIEQQIRQHPEDADMIFYRGQARGMVNDVDGVAADMLEYLAKSVPQQRFDLRRFWAYVSLISAFQCKKDPEAMDMLLRDALIEFPGHPHFLYHEAMQQIPKGNLQEGLRLLKQTQEAMQKPVRGLRPPQAAVAAHLADVCRALGHTEEALRWAKEALDCDPESVEAATMLARLYSDTGRLAEADELVSRFLPSQMPALLLVVAELRHRQGRSRDARETLDQAVKLGLPKDQAAPLQAAIQRSSLALKETAGSGDGETRNEGLLLLAQGENLKAAEFFAAAVQRDPTVADNYRYLAVALRNLGQEQQALEAWKLGELWKSRAANGSTARQVQGSPVGARR